MTLSNRASPDSVFGVLTYQQDLPPIIKRSRLEQNFREAPLFPIQKEQIITPIALKMLELLRAIGYTVLPNLPYLNTGSVVNILRLKKIHDRLEKLAKEISEHLNPEMLTGIKNIFDEFRPLIVSQVQNFYPHKVLADQLRGLIHEETNAVREIPDFRDNFFLVCMFTPPSSHSPIYVSPQQLMIARRVNNQFLINVSINGSVNFIAKIKRDIKIILGIFAHNKVAMDALSEIFKKNKIALSIEEGDSYQHTALNATHAVIIAKHIHLITTPVKNKWEEVISKTGIEFQMEKPSLTALYHELLHHIIFVRKESIPLDPSLDLDIWTNREEERVIGGRNSTNPLSENYLLKILGLGFRTRHTGPIFSLYPLETLFEIQELIHLYVVQGDWTSLLDLEYRDDIKHKCKPRYICPRILQLKVIENSPPLLKDQFLSLGYKERLSDEEQIEEYRSWMRPKTDPIFMNEMVERFPIPKEVFPELFSSPWIKDKKVQEKLLSIRDLDEPYKSMLKKEITEQSTHLTLEQLI